MNDSKTTELMTEEISPFSKSKCLRMLREAYGPTARIMQQPGKMTLLSDNKELFNVSGPHTGLPWALVQVGYDRLGLRCFIENGRVFVEYKERVKNEGPNEAVQDVSTGEAGNELRQSEGAISPRDVPSVSGQDGIVKL